MLVRGDWEDARGQIVQRIPIAEVYERYMDRCRKVGRDHVGLCPFHAENTPSARLYADGHGHCFGCGRHFDVFDLVQHFEGIDFRGAMRRLADEAGVALPSSRTSEEELAAIDDRRNRSSILSHLASHAERCLWDDPRGEAARTYLGARGIGPEIARESHVGFWPAGDESARVPGLASPAACEQLKALGFRTGQTGREFDGLQSCIVFPFIEGGRVVSMTGRGIVEKHHRKLSGVGTPPLFGGLAGGGGRTGSGSGGPRADACLVVCEGEFDVLTFRQAGIPAVGLLGATAHLDEAAERLRRCAIERIVLCLDADPSGEQATRLMGVRLGSRAWVARPGYPEGVKDANELLCHTADPGRTRILLEEAVGKSVPFLEWRLAAIRSDPDPVAQVRRLNAELPELLAPLEELERAALVDRIASGFKLPRAAVRRKVDAVEHKAGEDGNTPLPRSSGDWSGTVLDALAEHYRGLFYERNTDAGVVLTLWAIRRGETVQICLGNARQAQAALAPELGDVTGWMTRIVPGLEVRQVPTVLVGALARQVRALESKGGLTVLAQGLHLVEGQPVLVDRNVALVRRDGQWSRLDNPILCDRYFVKANPDLASWLPWDVEELNRRPAYTAEEALGLVHEAVTTAWEFRDPCDGWIHALLLFSLPWNCLWQRKILCHVRAPSNSGKSKLLNGLYYGRESDMPGGLLPCSHYTTNFTAAGLLSLLGNTTLVLILDEFEDSDQKRENLSEVLSLLRASSTGGAGRLRGTKDLRARVDRLNLPVMAGSIEPIGRGDADFNRWLVTELNHVRGHEHPRESLRRWSRERHVDWEALRRAVLLGLADRTEELRTAWLESTQDPTVPGRDEIDSRFLDGLLPLLATARVLGLPWREIARSIVDCKKTYTDEARENRRGNRLLEAILSAPIALPASEWRAPGRMERTTLGDMVEQDQLPLKLPDLGVQVEHDRDRPSDVLLWVYWPTASRSELLKGTEFATVPASSLPGIARDCDAWGGNGEDKRFPEPLNKKKATVFRLRPRGGTT